MAIELGTIYVDLYDNLLVRVISQVPTELQGVHLCVQQSDGVRYYVMGCRLTAATEQQEEYFKQLESRHLIEKDKLKG